VLFGLGITGNHPVGSGLKIDAVEDGSPASGVLAAGDKIISVDGQSYSDKSADDRAADLSKLIASHHCAGEATDGCTAQTPAQIVVERDGKEIPLTLTPKYDEVVKRTRVGFGYRYEQTKPNSVADATTDSLDTMWRVTSGTVTVFSRLFNAEERKQVSGVVGISDTAHEAIGFDPRVAILILAVVSLSLGLINLFPFLPLDGGHIFWSVVEKLRGRPVAFSTMEKASVLGFAFVMVLFFIGLSNDVGRLTD
jgi:regulator of sigma E protease